jgi:hypothetical protein
MKRSHRRRRHRLAGFTLPAGVKPWHVGLGIAAIGGIVYFATRKPDVVSEAPAVAQEALTAAADAVKNGEATPEQAAAAIAQQAPEVAQAAVAKELANAAVGITPGRAVSPAQSFKSKALAAGIAKGKVKVDPAASSAALARKIGAKAGRSKLASGDKSSRFNRGV